MSHLLVSIGSPRVNKGLKAATSSRTLKEISHAKLHYVAQLD